MVPRLRCALPPALGGRGELVAVEPRCVLSARGREVVREGSEASPPSPSLLAALAAELAAAGPGAWAVGYFAYEYGAVLEPLVAVPPGVRPLPDAWWAVMEARATVSPAPPVGPYRRTGPLAVSLDEAAFEGGVAAIRQAIGAGSVYQVNLTRRWETTINGDPAALFAALAGDTPPRLATYLEDRAQGWAVLCLTPELLLERRGQFVSTCPIKGTRPRLGDDARALEALAASGKDAAELAMIVDLERNDLNRVCRPGSVQVLAAARPLTTLDVVHHEAVVAGQLEAGVGWAEMLAAVFPGGSVTGAPKLAACRLIAELEGVPRSVYCGAVGVLRHDGDGTLALAIRTGYTVAGRLFFHAGSGITWESRGDEEAAESRAKVRRWFEVLEV